MFMLIIDLFFIVCAHFFAFFFNFLKSPQRENVFLKVVVHVLWKVLGTEHALLLISAAHLGGSSPFLSDVPDCGVMSTQVSSV